MCKNLVMGNKTIATTIGELESLFGNKIVYHPAYTEGRLGRLTPNSCLCPINLKETAKINGFFCVVETFDVVFKSESEIRMPKNYSSYHIITGFLTGNLDASIDANKFETALKKKLEERFPKAAITVHKCNGEGSLPHEAQTQVYIDGNYTTELDDIINDIEEKLYNDLLNN